MKSFRRFAFIFVSVGLLLGLVAGCVVFMEDHYPTVAKEVASGSIGSSASSIIVEDESSALNGLKIDFADDTFESSTNVIIREASDKQLSRPTGFDRYVSPCFEVDTGGVQPGQPVVVTVPFQSSEMPEGSELVLVSTDDSDWNMYWPEDVDRENGNAIFTVDHFSSFQLSSGHSPSLKDLSACRVTGFLPWKDGFPAPNDTDPGQCDAHSCFVKWYFENESGSNLPLMARYGEYEAYQISEQVEQKTYERALSTRNTDIQNLHAIIEAIRSTKELQYVGLVPLEGDDWKDATHVVLAYRWDPTAMKLYCYDPNTPFDLTEEVAYVTATGSDVKYKNEQQETVYEHIVREHFYSKAFSYLFLLGPTLSDIYDKWDNRSTELLLTSIGGGLNVVSVNPGDELQLCFSIRQTGYPIKCSAYVEIARDDDLQHPVLIVKKWPTTNLGELIDPSNGRSASFQVPATLPSDLSPGRYLIRTALVDESMWGPTDRDYQVIYDTTESGANNQWSKNAWIGGFTIGPCGTDTHPPTVSLNCGTPTPLGDVTFSWSGTDNCSTTLQYKYRLGSDDWSPHWGLHTSKSYSGLASGTYQFCVKARDASGNESDPKCCSVTVASNPCANDTQPPIVSLNCGTPTSSGNVTFSWSGSDTCSSSIQFQYKLANYDSIWSSWSSSTSKSYSGLASGTYQFCVKAKDEAGNISSNKCCTITVSRNPCANDSAPPSVTLSCGNPDSSGNVSFSWSGSDNCSSSIQYQYKLEGRDTSWSSWSSSTSKSYSGLSSGTYQFCVKAKDEVGNVSSSQCCTITVSRNPCANDSTPPSVTLNCGNPDSSGNVSFSWSGSDNCSSSIQYQYKLDNYDSIWSSWSSSTSKSYSGLASGPYQFCVKAKDEAGNSSSPKCCNVTVPAAPSPCPPPAGPTRFFGHYLESVTTVEGLYIWLGDPVVWSGVDFTPCISVGPFGVPEVCVFCEEGFEVSGSKTEAQCVAIIGYFDPERNYPYVVVRPKDAGYDYVNKVIFFNESCDSLQ